MEIDKILVLILTLSGALFTYWFFLMKKDQELNVTAGSVDIVVDGGYKPNVISIPKGKSTKINFTRLDPSSCLEEVVISDFKVRKYLPLDKKISIEIVPKQAGEYRFECGMNMYHGKIKVI